MSWYSRARCREDSGRLFYPLEGARKDQSGNRSRIRHAKELCACCPVRQDCLDYALSRPEVFGIWGGYDVAERKQLREDLSRQERRLGLVGGMRQVPPGIHRRAQGRDRPAEWYEIWYELGDRSVLIGHTRRLDRHLQHRAHPADGSRPEVIAGWVTAVCWLLEVWRSRDRTSDECRATEVETVRSA
jgi:WhiB family redox-sensing transcriptional regulator